ncbi:MAG: hypothetical protein AAFQ98_01360 [Bacteroidota bacterium]
MKPIKEFSKIEKQKIKGGNGNQTPPKHKENFTIIIDAVDIFGSPL